MFKTRLLSGIVLVIVAALLIGFGDDILLCGMGIISIIGMYELNRVFKVEKELPGLLSYLALVLYFANIRFEFVPEILIVIVFMIALMFSYVFSYPKFVADQIMASFFGLIYVGLMLSYVYQIRMLDRGLFLTVLIFFCSWGCDTCAYCAGMLFGKHKMSPKLSPKKSVEGAVGGVVGAVLLAVIYSFIFMDKMNLTITNIVIIAVMTAVAALISMVGDLTASAIKRNYDIKDYGTLIPGHGGILDRFDSMIITAPIIYYIALYFIK